jgi:hypothetical protein
MSASSVAGGQKKFDGHARYGSFFLLWNSNVFDYVSKAKESLVFSGATISR